MGNGSGKLVSCFGGNEIPVSLTGQLDDGLGHSFCYLPPDPTPFRSISGASVSANTSTPLSTCLDPYTYTCHDRASAFECTTSFASIPLQPIPRNPLHSGPIVGSGPLDRGFLSGPIERGFLSGPLEKGSGEELRRSFSHAGFSIRPRLRKGSLIRILRRAISRSMSHGQNSLVAPIKGSSKIEGVGLGFENRNLQWAQGKAGEDRVHVVVSEEDGWVFVGIYDGFNGPDAPDYLQSNLYSAVHKELRGIVWDGDYDTYCQSVSNLNTNTNNNSHISLEKEITRNPENCSRSKDGKKTRRKLKKWRLLEQTSRASTNHSNVLKALSKALGKTEKAYLELADNMVFENPELALMGSCVLVMLMKGEDVYVINVGDSRAVLARERPSLEALQLTRDHCTSVEEEVRRIRNEHPDDVYAVATNGRVKGSLKVTRAFGAGFLKQPKWNNALLEMFRIDYVGNSPYITCFPSLYHHRLGPNDRFLILSSDGLYQYFTNEQVVSEVDHFITLCPEGDPAQHLVEELLFRAASKAGMEFHELLEIPQGDRRRYHDDVSIVVISLEGRIWRSCV